MSELEVPGLPDYLTGKSSEHVFDSDANTAENGRAPGEVRVSISRAPLSLARRAGFVAVAGAPALASYLAVRWGRAWLLRRPQASPGPGRVDEKNAPLLWRGWSSRQRGSNLRTVMVVSPRWNPHAVQHWLDVPKVKHGIEIELASLDRGAKTWIISIYRRGREVFTLSRGEPSRAESRFVSLDSGDYVVFVRYYQPTSDAECPRVTVDGERVAEPVSAAPEARDYEVFLAGLNSQARLYYWFLHCHVDVALLVRSLLPRDFVRSLYLPFGNPDTTFAYAAVARGDTVSVTLDSHLLATSSAHIVFFDRCGFPVLWQDIRASTYRAPRASESGSCLVRIVGQAGPSNHARRRATGGKV